MQRGWRVSGRSVHIPVGENVSSIPFEIFDEWYIFSAEAPERDYKVFVKHDWFTLGPAQALYSRSGNAFDLKRMQRWFWQELEKIRILPGPRQPPEVFKPPGIFHIVLRGLSTPARLRVWAAQAWPDVRFASHGANHILLLVPMANILTVSTVKVQVTHARQSHFSPATAGHKLHVVSFDRGLRNLSESFPVTETSVGSSRM
jgi:hypothetical protein